MKVFIVDDSHIVRARLMIAFSEIQGIEIVGQAQNVVEARQLIPQTTPDVVILDIKLPDGSGIDVLSKIKKDHPHIVVIMLTNYPYPQFKEESIKAGADYFFDKSTEVEKLVDVLSFLN
ncbi:MAG: response regulator transcription factor [Ignavibacteriales bacterium]|nr:response regulator transcription factor [Ignavibacteriales bacterium]